MSSCGAGGASRPHEFGVIQGKWADDILRPVTLYVLILPVRQRVPVNLHRRSTRLTIQ